jgi:hypothetical protein
MSGNREVARTNGRAGGRPVGGQQGRARKRYLPAPGEQPCDIMHDNMMFWHSHVGELTEQLRTLIVDCDDEAQRAEAFKLLRELVACRENAQKCAVDLAPYAHAKYHSIEFVPPTDDEISAGAIPSDGVEASVAYLRLVKGSAA